MNPCRQAQRFDRTGAFRGALLAVAELAPTLRVSGRGPQPQHHVGGGVAVGRPAVGAEPAGPWRRRSPGRR